MRRVRLEAFAKRGLLFLRQMLTADLQSPRTTVSRPARSRVWQSEGELLNVGEDRDASALPPDAPRPGGTQSP